MNNRWLPLFISVSLLFNSVFASQARIRDPANVPDDVAAGYYDGRSGNIIVKPDLDTQPKDLLAIFIDESRSTFHSEGVVGSLPLINVADVISRSLGVQPPNSEFNPSFVQTNIFNSARANILFSLESVGEDLLSKYSLSNLQELRDSAVSFKLSYPVYPYDAVSVATSASTGKLPSQHGVVAKSWPREGTQNWAFVSRGPRAAPVKANVADVLEQAFDGQSLVISASSNPQHAFAFCPNYHILAQHPEWNFLCFALDPMSQTFEAMGPRTHSHTKSALESGLGFSAAQLRSELEGSETSVLSSLPAGVTAAINGDKVTVTFPPAWSSGISTVTYDLSKFDHWTLFAELQYAHSVSHRLSSVSSLQSLVQDDVPDFYAITFSSLTSLIEGYGREGTEVVGALHLVDALLPKFIRNYQKLYAQKSVVDVLLLGAHSSEYNAVDKREAFAEISHLLPGQEVAEYYPNLYVNSAGAPLSDACQTLSLKLDQIGYGVYCPSVASPARVFATSTQSVHFKARTFASSNSSCGNSSVSCESIYRYQIVLWFSIGAAFVMLWAIYTIGWMSFKKDTLLYSTFNPNWEDRKRH